MSIITIKGKSEEQAFNVTIPVQELVEFIQESAKLAEDERDNDNATSPGGFPTALFTAFLPAKARAAVGWNLNDGWNAEKAKAAFAHRLERKVRKLTDEEKKERAEKALATRRADYDARAMKAESLGLGADEIKSLIGERP